MAVMGATREILYSEGLDNLAIREVARRAGVHETTVYRRWTTKAALALDAIVDDIQTSVAAPDSGDLRTDLEGLLRSIIAFVATPGGSALLHLAARQDLPGYEAVRRILRAERFLAGVAVLQRAEQRGELRAGLDHRLLLESLIGPVHVRLLLTGGDLDETLVTATVDLFLRGVRP